MKDQIKIEASTLEEAFQQASAKLQCSINDLDIKILQQPSKGLLGIGKKNAIILVRCKSEEEKQPETQLPEIPVEKEEKEIFDTFYQESKDLHAIAKEVETDINDLFRGMCFKLEPVKVEPYDDGTLLIEFNGEDAALLIGKEGYRYKALSYMLFNWINPKYGLQIRLEIANFLNSQEEMIANYLKPLIEKIQIEGKGQTRVLDGVLVQIALKQLRQAFPDKYVAIREKDGGKYVIVNEFKKN
ncbi:Jag N-terminal domain-containing protein [Nitratiruptor sp. YY09-18]|uniref:Jag N-terminal domain-containing protein n=1 Tax=Nitratiruptor sp. YY09-18 TaxID=2724901 RepID=UPI00191542F2|nr:Jag N-terminal domain-containing protein [Nitratiruptor sp. YY09-18]BCD68185.1 spoIIIJ-associated protein [Nitratiruptor sp. YY09-18]